VFFLYIFSVVKLLYVRLKKIVGVYLCWCSINKCFGILQIWWNPINILIDSMFFGKSFKIQLSKKKKNRQVLNWQPLRRIQRVLRFCNIGLYVYYWILKLFRWIFDLDFFSSYVLSLLCTYFNNHDILLVIWMCRWEMRH
jgi:hypothetical protein